MSETACVPCNEKGHFCPAEVDLDSDRPMCRPCDLDTPCGESLRLKPLKENGSKVVSKTTAPEQPGAEKPKRSHKKKEFPKTATAGEHIKKTVEKVAKKAGRPTGSKTKPRTAALPWKTEVLSAAEYKRRFEAERFPDQEVMTLLRNVHSDLKPGAKMVVFPKKGESIKALRDRIYKTFKKYFGDVTYKLKIYQQSTGNVHVLIEKIGK